jgi:cell division septation protein DedD
VTVNRFVDNEIDTSGRGYAGQRQSTSALADSDDGDREISLGTPTILGIFFVLALVCACFFGFGYTLGRRSAPTAPAVVQGVATTGSAKPTAGSPSAARVSDTPAPTVVVPTNPPAPPPATTKNGVTPADGAIVGDKLPSAPLSPATNNQQPATSFMVQVAAVSSQDVADLEVAALAKKGYNVAVHHEPQDKLLHIQIGPFPDRKDADAMRARVLADGFNAIVK